MYERTFGTDWETLSRAEAIDRAFALGVAAACDRGDAAELERLTTTADGAYGRSLVRLAYDEGRTRALEASAEGPAAVWRALVDDAGTPRNTPFPAALPGALGELTMTRRRGDGPPSSLELPPFLRK
ncbi:hypothetical protein GRS48_02165 [Halorubrum sp. JWXQ-INN 858]|uniref:hypothetical protein n=1 Tax=Halorubrum sp. JWXQ-INN 858 TaxID=2690782 RepID=UPI00135A877E|nr:hypothetical protein [Halorubrum sp. JWXQ-INN 858]MWV63633.1 hypothetical protein [Halorubrum sp. JWXQ-INN 858]